MRKMRKMRKKDFYPVVTTTKPSILQEFLDLVLLITMAAALIFLVIAAVKIIKFLIQIN